MSRVPDYNFNAVWNELNEIFRVSLTISFILWSLTGIGIRLMNGWVAQLGSKIQNPWIQARSNKCCRVRTIKVPLILEACCRRLTKIISDSCYQLIRDEIWHLIEVSFIFACCCSPPILYCQSMYQKLYLSIFSFNMPFFRCLIHMIRKYSHPRIQIIRYRVYDNNNKYLQPFFNILSVAYTYFISIYESTFKLHLSRPQNLYRTSFSGLFHEVSLHVSEGS